MHEFYYKENQYVGKELVVVGGGVCNLVKPQYSRKTLKVRLCKDIPEGDNGVDNSTDIPDSVLIETSLGKG